MFLPQVPRVCSVFGLNVYFLQVARSARPIMVMLNSDFLLESTRGTKNKTIQTLFFVF